MELVTLPPENVSISNPDAALTNYYVWRLVFKKFKNEDGAAADCLRLRQERNETAVSFNHSNEINLSGQAIEVHRQIPLKKDEPARYLRVNAKELCADLNEERQRISFRDDGGYPHINMRYSSAVLKDVKEYDEVRAMIIESADFYEVNGDGTVSPFP